MTETISALQVIFTDNSNDSINAATPIGTLFPEIPITALGTINDFDGVDFYRLTVNTPLNSGIALQNLTGDLDVAVLDNNGNLIASGNNLGASNEAFQATFSTPGEYFINVFQTSPGIASDYELGLFPASANVNTTDNSNQNPNTPTFLGTLLPEIPINQLATINDFNSIDNYRITVNTPLTAGVALQNLTGDLDVAVLDSNGNLIASGNNLGASNEAFQVAFPTPGEYSIDVFQTAPGIVSNYELALFPASANIIPPAPPPPPVPPVPPPVPIPQPVNVSIESFIDNTDEAVRNLEDTAFVFKEDYLLNATPNTPITIDLGSINPGFDPLLEVYQIPQDSLLQTRQGQIPIAANDNGGGGVDARIAPDQIISDIPGISSQLTLSPEFNYLLRVTYRELPLIGGFTLNASVDNGFVSLTRVLLGNTIPQPIIGGDLLINGLFNEGNFF
ncbi:PPC domain-containing protein [Dapis sp. BLCC M229]|uniref:PPC domain-containing protein n=1 Tax=Dapis sp. BLCC M229 TaxID=3400188 RepID=UPI003CF7EB01